MALKHPDGRGAPAVTGRASKYPTALPVAAEIVDVLVDPLRAITLEVEQTRARDCRAHGSSGLLGADGGAWSAWHRPPPGAHHDRRRPACLLDLGPTQRPVALELPEDFAALSEKTPGFLSAREEERAEPELVAQSPRADQIPIRDQTPEWE
jgi:hypothetical protein